ncbi:MAG: PHB depolymerase family esterase [Betaproteobacteria bacterium]
MKRMVMKAIPAAMLLAASLSAQALTAGSGAWVKETATYGTPNLQDAYVFVPKNTAPAVLNGKRALMLTLHGCSQTASGNVINTKFNWEATAEQYGMVVVAPTVPSGTTSTRSTAGCWDWFGTGWTRTNRDQVPLKKLLDAVMARANLDIDPNQVYVTGLSSGGGETAIMGCAFPDIFAGVGVNAGPALGSTSLQIFSDPSVTAAQVATNCKAANGNSYNSYFTTQIWNTVYGSSDSTVKPTHNVRNGEGMRQVYGMSTSSTSFTVAGGGVGTLYKDANGKERVSLISVTGMTHAWPAGGGAGASYVDTTHINYPVWVTNWFFTNNLRVAGGGGTTTTTAATTTTTAAGTTTTGAATTTTAAATTTTTTATTTTTTVAGACFNASNYAHVQAGRAHDSLGTAYANGSNAKMGLDNTFYTSKLRQTGTNYYVIDSTCP